MALPFNGRYEPWTKAIYDLYCEVRDEYLFPFTRQKIWMKAKKSFERGSMKIY